MRNIASRLARLEQLKSGDLYVVVMVPDSLSQDEQDRRASAVWANHPRFTRKALIYPFPTDGQGGDVIIFEGGIEEARKTLMGWSENE